MELQLNVSEQYTYADYLTWMDNKKRELIDGFVKMMSPAPALAHATISRRIAGPIIHFIDKKQGPCQVFYAPFDVRLPKEKGVTDDDKIYTVVQPDICVVCDLAKLDRKGCLGAPDMIVEILSPSTMKYDLNEKFNLYQASGVKEYWVVTPFVGVNVFLLREDGQYDAGTAYGEYQDDVQIPVQTLPGLSIGLRKLFEK